MIVILYSVLVCLLNTLMVQSLLTRKKSIRYCIVAFIVNTLVVICAVSLVEKNIQSPILLKYILYSSAFLYIGYIYLVFEETLSKKIFTMFSVWIYSLISILIATPAAEFFSGNSDAQYILNYIYIVRICIQAVLVVVSYFWLSSPYKRVLTIVPDKTINFMSLYPVLAFLLLINNYAIAFERFKKFESIYDMLLLSLFIIVGYLFVVVGIYSSSKIISLQRNLESTEKQAEIYHYMANFDTLTGIANRASIMDQLAKIIEISNRNNQKFALFILDLDKFKKINDEYGHLLGDEALKYVVQIVQNVLRNTDSIGRFGGDEFVIIQPFIKDEKGIEKLIDRIFSELKTPLIIGENEILINISIGVSIFPDYALDLEVLLQQADSAMYEAKQKEGSTFCFFRERWNS